MSEPIVRFTACLAPRSLKQEGIFDLATRACKAFRPSQISTNKFFRRGGRFLGSKQLERIRSTPGLTEITLETKDLTDGPRFEVADFDSWRMQRVALQLSVNALGRSALLGKIWHLSSGFNVMHAHDADDTYWQSVKLVNNYEVFGRPWQHLKTYPDPDTGDLRVDISGNPARREPFPGMWLQAAWRMWYGEGAFRYFDRDRLLAFPDARRIEELPSGAVFIELFEDPLAYDDPENRRRQQSFRDWAGLDFLAASAHDVLNSMPSDPAMEIDQGSFPHGGVRRVRQWFNDDGELVARSKATYRLEAEYDEVGDVVWKGKLPADSE